MVPQTRTNLLPSVLTGRGGEALLLLPVRANDPDLADDAVGIVSGLLEEVGELEAVADVGARGLLRRAPVEGLTLPLEWEGAALRRHSGFFD